MINFFKLSDYFFRSIDYQITFDKYKHKEPFIKKFLGIENIDDDLVFWYISKHDELDCYIVDRYFKLTGYNKPTRKQVFNGFYNSFKEN